MERNLVMYPIILVKKIPIIYWGLSKGGNEIVVETNYKDESMIKKTKILDPSDHL